MKRRDFIVRVAAAGGSTYAAMKALNLLGEPATAQQGPFRLQRKGSGKRVIILGAGIAGMTSAYELTKAGYECTILEARSRSGGRCWTLRGGDQFTETTGITQRVQFDRDQYFNPGPARIPQHHITIDYCRELGVQLEVFANANYEQYYYNEGTALTKVRAREAKADIRGHVSELLAKAVSQDALNAQLSAADKTNLINFLRTYGGLNLRDGQLVYEGSGRRGYVVRPGAGSQSGQTAAPYSLTNLLAFGFAGYESFEQGYDQQMMMFQPVGGMDQIAKALERAVGPQRITFGAEVKEIRKTPEGVRIVYGGGSGTKQVTGDYCICTIPLSVLRTIPSDFAPDMQQAISSVDYAVTGKSALQFNRRFWEEDEQIMGGITSTNNGLATIWYPSYGYLSKKGVVVGYYNFGEAAQSFGSLAPAQRVTRALELGSRIHPQYRQHFENGVSLHWPNIPYNLGGWASYSAAVRAQYYPRLNEPDGNIYLAGEHLSYLTGWMAGAFESARAVTAKINART